MWISEITSTEIFELDELHWYINARRGHENGTNTFIMTEISREPRQIVGFRVDGSIKAKVLQGMVDEAPWADNYYTDGLLTYLDVDFAGTHIRNPNNKNDTWMIESTNADLRHYIPGLARKSRCFFRSVETLRAVMAVFVDAYNKFGEAKLRTQVPVSHTSTAKHLHKYRYPTFSLLDYL